MRCLPKKRDSILSPGGCLPIDAAVPYLLYHEFGGPLGLGRAGAGGGGNPEGSLHRGGQAAGAPGSGLDAPGELYPRYSPRGPKRSVDLFSPSRQVQWAFPRRPRGVLFWQAPRQRDSAPVIQNERCWRSVEAEMFLSMRCPGPVRTVFCSSASTRGAVRGSTRAFRLDKARKAQAGLF